MKAYGNHFRMEDSKGNQLQTYDSGVASVFDVPTLDAANVSMNFVGVLKDILKLDYGLMHTHVIIFMCEWVKGMDN
jgi:hypothetical protein